MSFQSFTQSSVYSKLLKVLGVLFLIFLIFAGGVAVGYHRGQFSNEWGAHYYGNMRGLRGIFEPFSHSMDTLNAHGAIGSITSVSLPSIVIQGPHQAEQIVTVSTSTQVRFLRTPGTEQDLKTGEQVVVIGTPDDQGRIQASLIRIMP